jgi:uncharacterized protein YukE
MASKVDSLYADVGNEETSAQRTVDGLPTELLCQQAASSFTTAACGLSTATHEQVGQIATRLTAMADAVDDCDQASAGLFAQVGAARGWALSSKAGPAQHVVSDTDELYELQRWLKAQAGSMGTDHDTFNGSMTQLRAGWQGLAAAAGDMRAQRSSTQLRNAQVFVSDVAGAIRWSAAAFDELGDGLSGW